MWVDHHTTAERSLIILQMVYYYKCLRFLLHPLLSVPETNINLIKKCAEACGGVCETYKKLHQNISVGFSLMALHSVFLAGRSLQLSTNSVLIVSRPHNIVLHLDFTQ